MTNYIALAIPFFFGLIAIELLWARRRGVRVYRLNDALTDLSCGVSSQMMTLFWAAAQLALYAWVFEHRLLELPSWLAWLLAFVGVDFAYYWWHRASHEVNFLWAAHIVHHQSEDYNLAVALRQSLITSWTSLPFYLPLALLGIPPVVFATTLAFSTLYQFWIHTQLIGKLRGPLEYLLNLPEHHRVHHAVNPQYLDKNYGATLIVWDRWFGSFEPENEVPVYGITKPLASFNPLWAQVHYWFELAKLRRAMPTFGGKLLVYLKPPSFHPPTLPAPTDTRLDRPKYDVPMSLGRGIYLLAQYALLVAGATLLIFYAQALPLVWLVASAVAVLVGVLAVGALIERARWALPLEVARLLATAALLIGIAL